MFCNNCGKELTDDVIFCTSCGVRVKKPMIPAVSLPVGVIEASEAETEHAVQTAQPAGTREAAGVPRADEPPKDGPKQFFGVGAFIICLIIIGLLSISTGVFAGLYFALR